jgi:hypothetical protein
MEFLGVLVLEEKELELAEVWKAEDLVKVRGTRGHYLWN